MVGAIVLATDQGLGYLARDFFKHGLIHKVYIHRHTSRVNHYEWYPEEARVGSIDELIDQCDTIFAVENFFDWKAIPRAREKGKKTVIMPMYECTPHPLPYVPDLILAPSRLDADYYPGSTTVTVPVAVPQRERLVAQTFVHNAGNGGLGGRNGTLELLQAMKYVKSPIKLILRSQRPIKIPDDSRIDYREGTFDDIWSEGDVFIFPEKFNGLSLPLQEAFASGMLVMCGDRYPMNEWLPNDPLIPVDEYTKQRIAVEFECAEFSPVTIAEKIDSWFGQDILRLSNLGITWGQQNSWKKLKDQYATYLSP